MYYVYIIKSTQESHWYTGHTSHLENRLKIHNSGKVKSTKSFRPWMIVYYEEFPSRDEAINREKFLKTGQGRKWIMANVKH